MNELIPIDKIDPNPYQTREKEDKEHVEVVALSIAERGLMQIPIGRRVNSRVQLAFGHTRLAAFLLLASEHPGGGLNSPWAKMPVEIQDLDDQQMFEMGIQENLARKDLTPIEEARAMRMYRDQFGKNSAEIGRLFGLSESTVRNKMRLLELPEGAQGHLANGELSEVTARRLLTLQKIAPERVESVATKLASEGFDTPAAISEQIVSETREEAKENKQVYEMWNAKWKPAGEEPKGGEGLWPLTWQPKNVSPLPLQKVLKILDSWRSHPSMGNGSPFGWIITTITEALRGEINGVSRDPKEIADYYSVPINLVEIISILDRPSACTACPLHSAIDGVHYCGSKNCWQRKRQAWYELELNRLMEETGILAYDKKRDGRDSEDASSWNNANKWREWFEGRADHLRLKVAYREWQPHFLTGSHCVKLVSVRKEAQEKIAKEREKRANQDQEWEERRERWRIERQNRDQAEAWLREIAGPVMALGMAKLDSVGFLEWLVGSYNQKTLQQIREEYKNRKDRVKAMHIYLVSSWLDNDIPYDLMSKGPTAVAEYLQGVAKSWGLQLPAEWMELAREYAGQLEPEEME